MPLQNLTLRQIFRYYWPLGISWFFLALEYPTLSAIIARLANPEINLAAYAGIVFPISLIITAPIAMILPASTTLGTDWPAYRKLRRFVFAAGVTLTTIHFLVAFTPLYFPIAQNVLGVPEEITNTARPGLMIMLPWAWIIAFRRLQQGMLIRFGHPRTIGSGSILRILVNLTVLLIGLYTKSFSGIVVGASAQISGITCETIFIQIQVRKILKYELKATASAQDIFSWKDFAQFYIPLALTSFLMFFWQPVTSAALSRMPRPIDSLAALPALNGLTVMLRSLGFGYQETVIALLDRPKAFPIIRRFAILLAGFVTTIHLLMVITPLSDIWFYKISALPPRLAEMAKIGLWITLPVSGLYVMLYWLQGVITKSQKTRSIPEALAIFLVTAFTLLAIGIIWQPMDGLSFTMLTFVTATVLQVAWLYRSDRKRRLVR